MRLLVVAALALAAHAGDDWLVPGGNPARNRRSADLPESFPAVPFWRHKLAERDPRWSFGRREWIAVAHDREAGPGPARKLDADLQLPYPTLRPLVRAGQVIYMDGIEIVVRNIGSGSLRPFRARYDPVHEFGALYPLKRVRPGSKTGATGAGTEDLYRFAFYGNGTAASSAERTVCVEDGRLFAYERRTGKTLWGWQSDMQSIVLDRSRRIAWVTDFRAHADAKFLGAGVIDGGRLYTLALDKQLELWCLDVDTGECRWRADVQARPNIVGAVGAAVAVADGVVYVCTHVGTVAAFKDGERLWSAQYGTGSPGFAYNDPVVAGDLLLVAPRNATHLTAYERATGKPAWTWKPPELKGSIAYIAGVTDEAVVMAGRDVVALRLDSGEPLWKPVPVEGESYGRGFVGQTHVFLPTKGERATIERFEIRTGARGPALTFQVEQLGNLLVVDGRLLVAGEDELLCFTTLQREQARPASLLDRALVAALHEDGAAAAKQFAALLQAEEDPYRRLAGLALRHLLRLARAEKNAKLLAVARKLAPNATLKAQVEVVAAQIETGAARERALSHLATARLDVIFDDKIVRSDAVARALRSGD